MSIPLTTVSGVIYNEDGAPLANAKVYLEKVIKSGTVIRHKRIRVATSDEDGAISFTVPRNSNAWISGSFYIGSTRFEVTNGVSVAIPDASTATLESLGASVTGPTTGLTVQSDGSPLSTLINTFNFSDDFTVTNSPTGTAQIGLGASLVISNEVVQDALATFFPDSGPYDWTYDDALNKVGLVIAPATSSVNGLMSAADKTTFDAIPATYATAANLTSEASTRGAADSALASSIAGLSSVYQPLNSKLSSIAALVNGAGYLHNDGSGNFVYSDPTPDLSGYVPTSRTVNGHALTANISVTASDVGLGSVSNNLQLTVANNLSDLNNAGTARTNLGLGSLATQSGTFSGTSSGTNTGDQSAASLGLVIGTNTQAWDADLDAIAALAPSNDDILQRKAGAWTNRTIAQLKTDLSLSGSNTGDQTITLTGDVTGSGTGSFAASIGSGKVTNAMLAGSIDLTAKVTGTLPVGNGGTGITSFGSGIATFLGTPSSANLRAALTDENGTGVALFDGATSPAFTTPAITGLATGSGVASAATASTLAARDSSANLTANNWLGGYTTTATAAGTTTLTVASTFLQFFTGSTTQTVTLPVASTLTLGHQFQIVNNSTGAVTVNSSGANAVIVLAAGTSVLLTCILASGTSAASWSAAYSGSNVTSAKKLTISNTLTLAGTDATTMTFPSTSATIARTDAAQTFTGAQTFTSPKIITDLSDTNGNELFKVTATASAVNEFTVANAAASGHPTLSATGSDTDINIRLTPKGAGFLQLGSSDSTFDIGSSSQRPRNLWVGNAAAFIGATIANAEVRFGATDSGGGGMGIQNGYFTFASTCILRWSSALISQACDISLTRAAAGVLEVSNGTAGGFGQLLYGRVVTAKTGNYTVLSADKRTFFTNVGAGGTVVFTLPTAVVGMNYTFYVGAAQTLQVTAGASTTIRIAGSVSASAGNITNATIGGCVTLVAISTTSWVAESHEGTWTVT